METLKKFDLVLGVALKVARLAYWLTALYHSLGTGLNYRGTRIDSKVVTAL